MAKEPPCDAQPPTADWRGRERLLQAFEKALRRGERPLLADYLAQGPAGCLPLLAELVHLDLEYRLRAGEPVRVEAYLADYPALAADRDRALSLIEAEYHLRRPREPDLAPEEYLHRFPAFRAELAPLTDPTLQAGCTTPSEPDGLRAPPQVFTQTPPRSTAHPPRVVGEYELGDELGGGGMGVVYRARHRRLDKWVALKLLPVHTRHSEDAVERFLREMRAVGGLKHPNVVEAYDAGEQTGVVYLAMELVEGMDLDKLVRKRGPLPVAEACALVQQAALGLQHLHERGLVHRDIKPSNLMRTAGGMVKVLDLGLARWRAETAGALTWPRQGMGTPDYIAPEQVRDAAAVDARADLYGLGGTLFHLLTGRAPFAHRAEVYAKMDAHRSETPADLRALRPEVPAALAELVSRLLAKNPPDRPQTAAEVAEALRPFIAGEQPPRVERVPTAQLSVRLGSPKAGAIVPGQPRARRTVGCSLQLAITLSAIMLIVLAGLGTLVWYTRPPPPSSGSPGDTGASGAGSTEPLGQPLVIRLRVVRLSEDGINPRFLGELGETTYRVRLRERIGVEAVLSEPAYTYLIAFNPAEKADARQQHIPLSEADRRPEKRDQLDRWTLRLNDGEGLQVFAVLASRHPLPAYTEWQKQHPVPWKRTSATSGVVWRSDGGRVEGFYEDGFDRATEEAIGDKAVIRELARQLRAMPEVKAVAVIGFAVDRVD
jgi:serine/threonine protein kinase